MFAYFVGPLDFVVVALIAGLCFSKLPSLLDWRDRFLWMERLRLCDPVRWRQYQFQHLMYLREQLEREKQRPMDWRPWLILANAVMVAMIVLLLLIG